MHLSRRTPVSALSSGHRGMRRSSRCRRGVDGDGTPFTRRGTHRGNARPLGRSVRSIQGCDRRPARVASRLRASSERISAMAGRQTSMGTAGQTRAARNRLLGSPRRVEAAAERHNGSHRVCRDARRRRPRALRGDRWRSGRPLGRQGADRARPTPTRRYVDWACGRRAPARGKATREAPSGYARTFCSGYRSALPGSTCRIHIEKRGGAVEWDDCLDALVCAASSLAWPIVALLSIRLRRCSARLSRKAGSVCHAKTFTSTTYSADLVGCRAKRQCPAATARGSAGHGRGRQRSSLQVCGHRGGFPPRIDHCDSSGAQLEGFAIERDGQRDGARHAARSPRRRRRPVGQLKVSRCRDAETPAQSRAFVVLRDDRAAG